MVSKLSWNELDISGIALVNLQSNLTYTELYLPHAGVNIPLWIDYHPHIGS